MKIAKNDQNLPERTPNSASAIENSCGIKTFLMAMNG